MTVCEKIRAYMLENDIKYDPTAQKAGISIETFYALLDGKITMYADDFRSICFALNVKPEVFINV